MDRSVQVLTFSINQITDKILQKEKKAYIAFVEKVFDRLPTNNIWESLLRRGTPKKLINSHNRSLHGKW